MILAVFVADFEALLVIGETRSKQHQIRREKLARDWGDRLELANWNLRKNAKNYDVESIGSTVRVRVKGPHVLSNLI